MITTKGQIIDINGKTEWLLFHRLSKKVNPVDFLSLTDSLIQFPNFLFTVSFFIMIFLPVDLQTKFIVPGSLYFIGQIIVNLRIGTFIFKLLNMPLLVFQKFYFFIMAGTFLVGGYFLGWWTLMIIPTYLVAATSSVVILTSYQKRYYQKHWNKTTGNYEIFKNNAFLHAYKYYSIENKLPSGTTPTEEEIKNQDWLKPYSFMRTHWTEIESHFNKKAKTYWRVYLHLNE
jgi:Zn-dependent protease with chaperone function